jgi:hypothetical protein
MAWRWLISLLIAFTARFDSRARNRLAANSASTPSAAGSVFDLIADSRHNHRADVSGGGLGTEASARLRTYFRRKWQRAAAPALTSA